MPLFHICPKSACCSCVCRGWPAQFTVRFLLFSGFPFFYGLLYLGLVLAWRWASPFFSPPFFSCSYLLPYHSIIPAAKLFASILPGLFRPTVYSSPNGPVQPLVLLFHHWRAPVSHLFFFFGRPWPIWFSWASLALKFAFPWAFTGSLGFSSLITLFLILGAHGIAINPLLSCFHYFGPTVTHSHFFTSYTAHGLLFFFFSFFPSSFKPIYPLKAHLFIL